MKFLVFGACGMAGHTIALYLCEQGHEVLGFDLRKSPVCDSITGDVMDRELVKAIVQDGQFDALINCVGLLNEFAEQNKANAVYLNSYWPHFLAEIASHSDTHVIHMSTDCVFSGDHGEYTETDFKDGHTFYDRTKALGELDYGRNITLRNSIIGPDINPNGIGLFNWFMKQSCPIKGYREVLWTGLTTLQLAKTMERAAMERASGLYNMVFGQPISKYNLLNLVNEYMRSGKIRIDADDNPKIDKSLKRTNFNFAMIVPDYTIMMRELAEWIFAHKALYPHYNLEDK